jgi:nucleoside-diphosphate-sugar epimerase
MTTLRIAVTGASGYVGSQLVTKLKSQGHYIVALGRKPTGIADIHIPFSLDENNEKISLQKIDTLIHCAYDFKPTDYASIHKINFSGTIKLFEQAQIDGVKNIIFISTTSAFDGTISNYGRVKYEIENYVRSIGGVVVRAGLIFSKNAGGIVGALNNFVKKFPFAPLIGKGDQRFYPCHLDDLCSLLNYLVSYDDFKSNLPIIAASEHTITFREIILMIAQSQNKHVIMIRMPYVALFVGLFFAELLKINVGLRSDSLRYMKQANYDMNFWFTKDHGTPFRSFNATTILS